MIEINSAIEQDKIIALLNAYDKDGVTFAFKEKKGIKMIFTTTAEDLDEAALLAKKAIKAEPWSGVVYFNAVAHR